MATVSRTRTVAATPHDVWEVLADFGAISSWAPNVDHSCLLGHGTDCPALGTSRRVQVGRDTFVESITELRPDTALAYDIAGLPRRLRRVGNRWTLRPGPSGRTEVTLTSTVEIADNPVARIAERAMCRFLARQSDTMLTGLAQRVEVSHV